MRLDVNFYGDVLEVFKSVRPAGGEQGLSPSVGYSEDSESESLIARRGNNIHSNTLGMDSCQVSIFEERDKICLCSFLKGHHGR